MSASYSGLSVSMKGALIGDSLPSGRSREQAVLLAAGQPPE
jgi:hypothetical protein